MEKQIRIDSADITVELTNYAKGPGIMLSQGGRESVWSGDRIWVSRANLPALIDALNAMRGDE